MKKRFLSVFLGCLFLYGGLFCFNYFSSQYAFRDYALLNIEALAESENDGTGARDCKIGKIYEDSGSPTAHTMCDSRTSSSTIYPCQPDKRGRVYGYTLSKCTTGN